MDNWVSVNQQLPEADGRYLVIRPFMDHYRIEIYAYISNLERLDDYEFKGRNDGGFFYYDSEWGEYYETTDILYWMPLPELPLFLKSIEEVSNDH